MINALDELSVNGVETTAGFLQKILKDEDYQLGHLHTRFVEERMRSLVLPREDSLEDVAVVSAVLSHYLSNRQAAAAVVPARNERHVSLWKAAWRAKLFPNGDWRWIR
jgi:acetyl/propionyl-CoA carboxylase alpha subunit